MPVFYYIIVKNENRILLLYKTASIGNQIPNFEAN